MSTDTTWEPFGIPDEYYDEDAQSRSGQRVLNVSFRRPKGARKDERTANQAGTWLRAAMGALGILAAAAAVVSFEAQYRMVFAAKNVAPIAALEAAIPDVAALVFASLGIALALHGRQAIRARVLNVGAVATSIAMNLLAAGHGFRDLAIWVMPPVAYALASDTAIGVIRSHAIARQRELSEALAGDETTPLAVLAGIALWLLRLAIAPPSTLKGFRGWVLDSCPVAPGRRAMVTAPNVAALPAASETPGSAAISAIRPEPEAQAEVGEPARQPQRRRGESKTARFLALVAERYGDLAGIDPAKVSRICSDLAPQIGLNEGSARSALRPRVLAARGGAS